VPKQYNLCSNLQSVNFVNDLLLIKVGHRDIKDRQPTDAHSGSTDGIRGEIDNQG
jgi:hypothetical protein